MDGIGSESLNCITVQYLCLKSEAVRDRLFLFPLLFLYSILEIVILDAVWRALPAIARPQVLRVALAVKKNASNEDARAGLFHPPPLPVRNDVDLVLLSPGHAVGQKISAQRKYRLPLPHLSLAGQLGAVGTVQPMLFCSVYGPKTEVAV